MRNSTLTCLLIGLLGLGALACAGFVKEKPKVETTCPQCSGRGKVDCAKCERGIVDCPACTGGCSKCQMNGSVSCPSCQGQTSVTCSVCNGSGH